VSFEPLGVGQTGVERLGRAHIASNAIDRL
jgi:hypothetical protein